jgi:ribosomal protein L9
LSVGCTTAQRRKKMMEEKTLKVKIEERKYEWKMKCKNTSKVFHTISSRAEYIRAFNYHVLLNSI